MFGSSLGFKPHHDQSDAGFLKCVDIDGSFILPIQSLLHVTYRSEIGFLDTEGSESLEYYSSRGT